MRYVHARLISPSPKGGDRKRPYLPTLFAPPPSTRMPSVSPPLQPQDPSSSLDSTSRCWICLGGEGETPSGLADFFVQPCACSLRAHRRCLIEWTSTKEPLNQYRIGYGNQEHLMEASIRKTDPSFSLKDRILEDVCPQCNQPIYLGMRDLLLVLGGEVLEVVARRSAQLALVGIAGASLCAASGLFTYGTLTLTGYHLMQSVTPPSVQLALLGVKRFNVRTFYQAMEKELVPWRKMLLLTGLPVYVFSLRGNLTFADLYPFLFFDSLDDLVTTVSQLGPRAVLWKLAFVLRLYAWFFAGTFNRVYRRWTREVRQSEVQSIWTHNHSLSFLPKRLRWSSVVTTLLWPVAGEIAGRGLSRIPFVRLWSNRIGNTPDEALWVRNLLGCCLVVVAKDLWHLYYAWKKMSQLRLVEVAEPGKGLYEKCAHRRSDSHEPEASIAALPEATFASEVEVEVMV